MLRRITVLLAAIAMFTLTAGGAQAAGGKCTITAIKDSTVTLDCGNSAAKLKVGDTVKVKTVRKKAIEGC